MNSIARATRDDKMTRMDSFSLTVAAASSRAAHGLGAGNFLPSLGPSTANAKVWETVYASDGIAMTIVDRPAEDSLARGITIENDQEHLIPDEFDRLGAMGKFTEAVRYARMCGGAIILMICSDGGSLRMPLDLNSLDQVVELRVYRGTQVSVDDTLGYYTDPEAPKFGEPRAYRISPKRSGANVSDFVVHESRCIVVPGEPMPEETAGGVPWMGRSVLQGCYADLQQYRTGLRWANRILERKQSPVYAMEGLGDMMANDEEEVVRKRLEMLDLSRNLLNTTAIDKNDEFTIENLGLDGVQATIEEFKVSLASSARMPMTILYGVSPSGMSGQGEGDLQAYYTVVTHYQRRTLMSPMERFVTVLWAQRAIKAKEPDTWRIKFNPLWLPTASEVATAGKTEADERLSYSQALKAQIEAGIVTEEMALELMRDRFPEYSELKGSAPGKPEEVPAATTTVPATR